MRLPRWIKSLSESAYETGLCPASMTLGGMVGALLVVLGALACHFAFGLTVVVGD